MSTLVVGSVALDTVSTPYGTAEEVLGGTAVFFSVAACHFTSVSVVAVVGDDFPDGHVQLLQGAGCDLEGLQRAAGKTFRWAGRYDENMNVAHTLDTQLNVFESFRPDLAPSHRVMDTIFLGNIDPELQLTVLEQSMTPNLVALDTMNFWISGKREALVDVMKRVDVVLINEDEARQLAGVYRIAEAARYIRELGPRVVVIKRGEYGSAMFTDDSYCALPAYPSDKVRDTTGAGDTFAGGFLGYLDATEMVDEGALRRALAYGTVMASFAVEDFSVGALHGVGRDDVQYRLESLRRLTSIDTASEPLSSLVG